MRELGAAGVVWHGAELAMQERRVADGYGSDIVYTFLGDKVAEAEQAADTAARVLTLQLGFPFSRESFSKVKILRDTYRVVSFYEVIVPFGGLSLRQERNSRMVLMSPYRVTKALQDDMVAELSAEYIGEVSIVRQLHIAFGFIKQGNKYLLQLRNGDPKIGGAGLIGCFGGKINEGEDPLLTFCREVFEEASLSPKPHEVKKLGMVKVKSDHNLEPVEVTAHVFHWSLKDKNVPEINEGDLVVMTLKEAMASLDKMTTGTRAAFEELM